LHSRKTAVAKVYLELTTETFTWSCLHHLRLWTIDIFLFRLPMYA